LVPSLIRSHQLPKKAQEKEVVQNVQKFEDKDSISSIQQLKSSVQKGIRAKLLEAYPKLETHIDLILPKKDSYRIAKCHDHIELLLNGAGEQVFFRHRDGPWMPTLRLLHKFPYFVTMQQVDKGAIRFVLSGANVMCPGLTSPGACMTPADKSTVVAIMAEGKEHALAIGLLTLSTEEILAKNKGIGIETYHFLNDGLWKSKPVK
ncbi:malignant T-cell-amplified sequence 1 homolog, partial [Drosophila ficusphila]|uniref:malignant T-cell-amplified sequence 1 homolog n=1 Tax=Drosophila ficusphila TaxID=30025 RepID=UPI001C8A90F3